MYWGLGFGGGGCLAVDLDVTGSPGFFLGRPRPLLTVGGGSVVFLVVAVLDRIGMIGLIEEGFSVLLVWRGGLINSFSGTSVFTSLLGGRNGGASITGVGGFDEVGEIDGACGSSADCKWGIGSEWGTWDGC